MCDGMKDWWKEATVYQIYPRSFADTNGDGIGDIRGIISRLDYIKRLGADVIWLCPVYKSPDVDNGYDVSDYRSIDKKFGSMADFDTLLREVHKRKMRLIMDAVFNHTSDRHGWFIESRKSMDNKYRDYYFWRSGKNGREPNNWISFFGGSAWEYDEGTGQYYFHLFSKEQPDLNWANADVRNEIHSVMRWWLDKGIDGFRFDTINHISKIPGFPDAKPLRGQKRIDWGRYYKNGPKVHFYLNEMNRKVLSKYDIMSVGETAATLEDIRATKLYVDRRRHELDMVFHENNEIRSEGGRPKASNPLDERYNTFKWRLGDLKRNFTAWQTALGKECWDSVYLGNHDYPRMVSHFGDDGKYRVESAKMLATMLFTLRGTPYIYQGDEIGMTNAGFGSIKDYADVWAINMYNEYTAGHKGGGGHALKILREISRDNARTPMQWNAGKNAGFGSGKPWIKINPNYGRINVESALRDRDSIFYYYKRLIKLRKEHGVMVYGRYRQILKGHPDIYAYTRSLNGDELLVLLNFTAKNTNYKLPRALENKEMEFFVGNYTKSKSRNVLRPYEAIVRSISQRRS